MITTENLFAKFAVANFLVPNLPAPLPIKWLKRLGIHELPGGLKVEDFDYLHNSIYVDEVCPMTVRGNKQKLSD